MKEKKYSKEISKITPQISVYVPSEIIWLIFTHSDEATLTQCARTCYQWHFLILSNPFLKEKVDTFIGITKEELGGFIEKIKNERERLSEIDPLQVVDIALEHGSTTAILNQLQLLEYKIEKNQAKLNQLIEKQEEKKQQTTSVHISVADPFGGGSYHAIYEHGHQPSFFGDIKRMVQKAHYKKNIKDAEKEEEKMLNNFSQ